MRDMGGMVHVEGGQADASTGGKVEVYSGYGAGASSGDMEIQTANAGSKGVSGTVTVRSGNATVGTSGSINMVTGNAKMSGVGGDIVASVGKGYDTKGGGVFVSAGDVSSVRSTGGDVKVAAGAGTNHNQIDGGKGGSVEIVGGEAQGRSNWDIGKCYVLGRCL